MRLARLAAAVLAVAAYAFVVGRLKTLYFLRGFGLPLAAAEPGWRDALFESWYVLQNAAYFAAVCWLAAALRRAAWVAIAALYAAVPLLAHYGTALSSPAWVVYAVDHQHTFLKFAVPLLAGVAWLAHPRERARWLRPPRAPNPVAAAWLVLLVASWGISAAKHFGSYDARRILQAPAQRLPAVRLSWADGAPGERPAGPLRLLHADDRGVIVLDGSDSPAVWRLPAEAIEAWSVVPPAEVQPGGDYL